MFELRGITVSLTFFVLAYCLLSALVVVTWRSLNWFRTTQRHLASLLFALRVLPLAAAVIITFGFVVPSFQLLEPRSIDEGLGSIPLGLGICALLLIAFGCFRVIAAQTETSRVVAYWMEGARPLDQASGMPTVAFQARHKAPPLTLVGVHRPKVLVSQATIALLTRSELEIALKHELAHMQSRDNLKKLVFRLCPFPGMSNLEGAWSQATELAADDAAVSKQVDALDLAAALVKISREVPVESAPICTTGFVTGSIRVRVGRLLAWDDENSKVQSTPIRSWYAVPSLLLVLLCIVSVYRPALFITHEVTEWLVR